LKKFPYKMIYFFGSDGTGKTEHANLTSSYLRKNGYRTWRATVKQHHTFAYLFLSLLRKSNEQEINYYGFKGDIGRKIRTPWKILELVSLVPAIFYRVILPSLLGYIVVCDRYVIDTLVTLSYFLKEPGITSGTCAKLLTRLIPNRSILIYLEADTAVILKRKKDEPLTKQLIEHYKRGYENIVKLSGLRIIILDTSTATVEEVQDSVLQLIEKK